MFWTIAPSLGSLPAEEPYLASQSRFGAFTSSMMISKQLPLGFGNCQQRTLADIVGQLIYPLEIVENPIASYVGQGLDGGLEAGIQFGGCRIPVEACRESDITLLK